MQPIGFEYEEEIYKSLSAVAKQITGSHCNGYLFFRPAKEGGRQMTKARDQAKPAWPRPWDDKAGSAEPIVLSAARFRDIKQG